MDLDTSVEGASFVCIVRGNRAILTVTGRVHAFLVDTAFCEGFENGLGTILGELEITLGSTLRVGVSFDGDFDGRILAKNGGDFVEKFVGARKKRGFGCLELELFVELDLALGDDDELARRRATVLFDDAFFERTLIDGLADIDELIEEAFFGDPRITNGIVVAVGHRATEVLFCTAHIGAKIFLLAELGELIGHAGLFYPRIADLVAVGVRVHAAAVSKLARFCRAVIDAFARKVARQALFGNPRIANAVLVGIGIGAARKLGFTRRVGALVLHVDDAVAVTILRLRILAERMKAVIVRDLDVLVCPRDVILTAIAVAVAQFEAAKLLMRLCQCQFARGTAISAIVDLICLFRYLLLLRRKFGAICTTHRRAHSD